MSSYYRYRYLIFLPLDPDPGFGYRIWIHKVIESGSNLGSGSITPDFSDEVLF
jgi:hypothetical protein